MLKIIIMVGAHDGGLDCYDTRRLSGDINQFQDEQKMAVESSTMNYFGVDSSDEVYQLNRSGTTQTLDVITIAGGGYKLLTGIYKAARGFSSARNLATTTLNPVPITTSASAVKKLKRFKPDVTATGEHTMFRRNPNSGIVTHYETYRPQTNPLDPKPWESVKRFDGIETEGRHYNKVQKQYFDTPHVHDPMYPGGVRNPQSWEIPG